MATSRVSLTGGANWTSVALDGEEFIIENPTSYDIYVTFQSSTPDLSETGYHTIEEGQALVRMNQIGDVFVRSPVHDADIQVTVS